MRPRALLLLLIGLLPLLNAPPQAQPAPARPVADTTARADSLWQLDMEQVVVTATRAERSADDVGVPVSVIEQQEIEAQGAARATDLLADQPGLSINNDHGSGLQMRGLGPEYTLILLDGEPIVGRTAGTLDLGRLTTANIERVEVVRGPTSSLYGSEALAGVVNFITGAPAGGLGGEVRTRYGTHGTVDLSARLEGTSGPWQGSVFVDRYRTGGYDLSSAALAPTRPGYVDYTAQARGRYEAGPSTTLSLRGRLATQSQNYDVGISADGTTGNVRHAQQNDRHDWNASAEVEQQLGAGWRLTGTLYGAGYHTDQSLRRVDNGTIRSESVLDQYHGEAEAVLRGALGNNHLLTVGAGTTVETIDADRKTGTRRGGFGFVQDEWSPLASLDVTGSLRLDGNSDYASRLSPKMAVRYAPFDRVSFHASVGSGYKAPAFRQLYLNFTNPQAGYSVFGTTEAQRGLQQFEEQGQIDTFFRDPSTLGEPLAPETSWAFNAGFTASLWGDATLRLDAYHNEVDNLIDAEAVARKTNGQSVFTYVNRNEIYTRGVEARLTLRPTSALRVQLGYDYQEAKDRQVLDELEAGDVYRRENGRDVQVSPDDYAGLPGRPAHTGTVQLRHMALPFGLTANVQGTLRGRAGYADRNGNGIVDVDREYVEARTRWDVTVSKTLLDDYTLRLGGENLFDYTNPRRVPSIPGRTWFAELQAQF
ncbi:TonB-dependent receptor plug domain-containing protein [Salinibacter ruber]|uniref:Outer membrane receptor for ferrienterochelin and colicins n=1 Tax=Salinibacter ruber TaxID=146919 RepID=A0A9X2U2W8_9BACT|nr:TonB-dependent receptor [Salinibacter ruber]MCS3857385.1 outer membrane receptor for ferrienterochelin and colicins [Salinibacter ruber]MCS3864211.1 outer membrane receptor for ferrienterochelin and colicins [Salinibacter ruber]MCS4150990.1 outer membrane receptor for ferrienterochelin and colicins [Salinibacter ruber]MCS4177783.1 outer membrane receptor for ferrienterochelin and colicins [Salinibacter ruber]